ncbi:MAG TPA: hypothetical protein VI197_06050 [Polyangiaceae bacterium]
MSELRRWLDDTPPSDVRRLLEAGQWARPSGTVLEQTLLRVRAGAVADPADAAVPMDQGGAVRAGIKWSVVGALLLGSVGALMLGLRPSESASVAVPSPSERAPLTLRTPAPAVAAAPRPVAQSEPARAVSSPATPPSPPPQAANPVPRRPRGVAAPVAAEGAPHAKVCKPAVVDQISMLEQAKGLIQRGRGAEALAVLDRYDALGAGRCFVPESMKHRMDAYAQTGNAKGAARTATSIKKDYPDTAQARAADAVLKHQ